MKKRPLPQRLTSTRFWLEGINAVLKRANLRIDTLTAAKQEAARLAGAQQRGWFKRPVFAVPKSFESARWREIVDAVPRFQDRFDTFTAPDRNDVGYQYENPYFRAPDTEVLYTIVRMLAPACILETGCGHSTRITRQAIIDGKLPTKVTCIDPWPRRDLGGVVDEFIQARIETQDAEALAASLKPGDVLFIDTSHVVHAANDCAFIFCSLLPRIAPGVIVHIHDIFLPWDYTEYVVLERGFSDWGENYLAHALINEGGYDVLWPGYWLQQTQENFSSWFKNMKPDWCAQSLWLVKR